MIKRSFRLECLYYFLFTVYVLGAVTLVEWFAKTWNYYILPVAIGHLLIGLVIYIEIRISGFGDMQMEPEIIPIDVTFDDVTERLKEKYKEPEFIDDVTAYCDIRVKRLKLRVMVAKDYNGNTFSHMETRRRAYVGIPLQRRGILFQPLGITFVFCDKFDKLTYDMAVINANDLFSRKQRSEIDVYISESEKFMYMPVHYGINGVFAYRIAMGVAEKLLGINIYKRRGMK